MLEKQLDTKTCILFLEVFCLFFLLSTLLEVVYLEFSAVFDIASHNFLTLSRKCGVNKWSEVNGELADW